jgi:Ca-activated chloride channel family protein
VVTLRYVEPLGYADGAYELVYPMVAGPRHVPATSKLTDEEARAVQAPVLPAGLRSSHDIEVNVAVDAGVPVGEITSSSHHLSIARGGASHAWISLAAGDTVPNKDFILRYTVAGAHPEFAVVANRADLAKDGSFFFVAEPPRAAAPAQVTPKEMVFVIDTSSSMRGRPLAKAREAIHHALAAMNPDDTFQIIRFDDDASALGARPIANKPRNVELALAWLDAIEAGGGTDMMTGVRAALEFQHDPARLRIVAFLTDGFIGDEDEILGLVQEKLGASRIFSFGVGSAVNRYLLEELATIGRGAAQIVRPDEDTTAAVEQFTARIAQPVLTDVSIDWHGLAVKDVTPAGIPDLFVGQPIVLSGHYSGPGSAKVTVHGRAAGREVSFEVPVALPALEPLHAAVPDVWARARIGELSRKQLRGEREEIKKEIIALALERRLVTRYTSFVAVDASRVTSGGKAETVPVPVEIPEGVDLDRQQANQAYGGGEGGMLHMAPSKMYDSDFGGGGIGYAHGTIGLGVQTAAPLLLRKVDTFEEKQPAKEPPAPVTTVGKSAGTRDTKVAIDGLVMALRADVKVCYEQALKTTPALVGMLMVHLVLNEDGKVSSYAITKLPGQNDVLNRCLDEKIPSWRLSAKSTEVDLPFQLLEVK